MIADPDSVPTMEVLACLSVAGALSMGQPVDHGARTAVIAHRLAARAGLDERTTAVSCVTALLRWSGCTANAQEFAGLLGDDILGRATLQAEGSKALSGAARNQLRTLGPDLPAAHCEVARLLAVRLDVDQRACDALRFVFEHWNGEGWPHGRSGTTLPVEHFVAVTAGEIDVALRHRGPDGTPRERWGSGSSFPLTSPS